MAWTEEARRKAAEARKRKAMQNAHAKAMQERRKKSIKNQGRSDSGKLTGYSGKQSTDDLMRFMGTALGQIQANWRAVSKSSAPRLLTKAQSDNAKSAARTRTGQFQKSSDNKTALDKVFQVLGGDLKLHAARLQDLYVVSKKRPSLSGTREAKAVFDRARKIYSGKLKVADVLKPGKKKTNETFPDEFGDLSDI